MPGGQAAYPSTVLMSAIPARIAGVANISMVTPGSLLEMSPAVLYAAQLAGVKTIYTMGGAHAIAALAYGTESIGAVDKIVGPGNAYVVEAKRQVFGHVGIDMLAGPSEILILCDGKTDVEWVTADLFSQAEHDEQARAILVCPARIFLTRVATLRLTDDARRARPTSSAVPESSGALRFGVAIWIGGLSLGQSTCRSILSCRRGGA